MEITSSGSHSITNLLDVLRESQAVPGSAWFVTACVTIVEAHVDRVLKRLIDSSGLSESLFGSALLAKYAFDFTRTWSERFHWLDRGFGITVAGESESQDMQTAIELRNAIVHGNMLLTDIQVDKLGEMIELKRRLYSVLEVDCKGRQISISQNTVERTVRVCVRFIRLFDTRLLTTYPSLPSESIPPTSR